MQAYRTLIARAQELVQLVHTRVLEERIPRRVLLHPRFDPHVEHRMWSIKTKLPLYVLKLPLYVLKLPLTRAGLWQAL
jgi:hypothetical protein